MENEYTRYVGFLDLLGFSNYVNKSSMEEVITMFDFVLNSIQKTWERQLNQVVISGDQDKLEMLMPAMTKYLSLKKEGNAPPFPKFLTEIVPLSLRVVSDTIIVYSKTIKNIEEQYMLLEIMMVFLRELMAILMSRGIVARGSVAYGEFFVDPTNTIFFGKSLIEATELEKRQNWMGVCVCDSVEKILGDYQEEVRGHPFKSYSWLGQLKFGSTIINYPVPMKNNTTEERIIVHWAGRFLNGSCLDKNLFDNYLTNIDSIDRKYLNTFTYLSWWEEELNKLFIDKKT